MPAGVGVTVSFIEFTVSTTISVALLTLSGIFSAFFFQLSVQLLNRAAEWAESNPETGKSANEYAHLLEVLGANSAYAALVATGAACAALATAITRDGWPESVTVGIAVALATHLIVTLLLVAARVFLLTKARLNAAVAGRSPNH